MAIKLNRGESAALLTIMEKPGWDVLLKLLSITVSELEGRKATGENEFQVLRSLFTREGKIEGLKEFFNSMDDAMSQ